MINNLWMYAALPMVPAVLCVFILIRLYKRKMGNHYIKLFSNLVLMNFSQAIMYVLFSFSVKAAGYAADAYLIAAYFFFTHLMMTSIFLSDRKNIFINISSDWLYAFPLLLTFLHFNGLMVESYRVEQNSLMHNDGSFAWCFDLYIMISNILTIYFLLRNVKHCKKQRMTVSKNLIAIISFIPLIIVFFIVVALSSTKYAIPVAVIGPTITFYTALSFYYISQERVIDLSIGGRFFWDRLKLAYKLLETDKTKADMRTFHKHIDKQFIKEALYENDRQIQATADYLRINHTTLRNKIKEYSL